MKRIIVAAITIVAFAACGGSETKGTTDKGADISKNPDYQKDSILSRRAIVSPAIG
jgi:hypothetical protein